MTASSPERMQGHPAAIRPFRLAVAQEQLDDLQERLARARWPAQPGGTGWGSGVPLDYLRGLVEYWRTGYDWRAQEAELNRFPQFTTRIDGAGVHFLYVRSPEPDALPVIMTHGWPGSVVEFLDVIGPLTDPRSHGADPTSALHLVLPHLPGYGLSGPTEDIGWTVPRIAQAWAELMHRLGYVRYGAQGGDWGHAVSLELAVADPDHVVGVHVNTLLTLPPTAAYDSIALDADDQARLQRFADVQADMSGYAHLQATRPQTLAYGLTDSPLGQLAWIVEKFHDWADPRSYISPDRLLTNVMLYWFTSTAGSSARLYGERYQPSARPAGRRVPTGVAVFAGDLATPVRRLAERSHNITRWTELEPGGHFAALEQPDLFAADVRAFFHHLR